MHTEKDVAEEATQLTGGDVNLASLVDGLEGFGEALTEMQARIALAGVPVPEEAMGGGASDAAVPSSTSEAGAPDGLGIGTAEQGIDQLVEKIIGPGSGRRFSTDKGTMIQADELNMSRRLVALVVMGKEGAEGAGKGSWSGCPFMCFDPLVEAAVVDGQQMGDVACGWAVQECLEATHWLGGSARRRLRPGWRGG